MSEGERRFVEDGDLRKVARGLFDIRLAQVKDDLAARGIGGRIADKAKADALDLAKEGLAVARESKGIIAATTGALLVWAFRKPILAAIDTRLGGGSGVDVTEETPDDEDSDSD